MRELGMADYLFPWPTSSPDMSPIEAIWHQMKRRITRRDPRPTTVPDLLTAISAEWDLITPTEVAHHTARSEEHTSELQSP